MRIMPLVILAFVTFALGFGELMIAAVLSAIAVDLRVSIPLTGQLVTVYALAFAALSAPLAVAVRRARIRPALSTSLLIVAAANTAAAVAPHFGWLMAARVVAAAGSALATPLALGAIDGVAPDGQRGRAHGIVFTGFSFAAMLGVPLGALVAAAASWRATFGCAAVLAALAALGAARAPGTHPSRPVRPDADVAQLLRDPGIRRALTVSLLFLSAQYTAFTYFRPFFAAAGSGTGAIVALFFIFGAFGIAGTLLGGLAVDRWGTQRALFAALGGCTAAFAGLGVPGRSELGGAAAVAVWALTSWAFSPAMNRELDRAAGPARNVALAFNITAFNLGIAGGSALGGSIITLAGIERLPLAAAVLCATALLIALPAAPQRANAAANDRTG